MTYTVGIIIFIIICILCTLYYVQKQLEALHRQHTMLQARLSEQSQTQEYLVAALEGCNKLQSTQTDWNNTVTSEIMMLIREQSSTKENLDDLNNAVTHLTRK